MDECGIAYKLMPLGSVFCRRLGESGKDVKQYLYTLVQEHAVWHNQQFWEASFYCDLQKGIEALYAADNPGLVADSILFCRLFTVKDWCEKVHFKRTILDLVSCF